MRTFFTLLLISAISFSTAAADVSSADRLYNSGQFDSALVEYKKILGEKEHSASLYFAIGNCYYRTGDPVLAILYYEKAAKLDPGNPDLKANIQFVRKQFKDKVNTDRSGISGWMYTLINGTNPNQWTWLAIILINFGFLSFIVARFSSHRIGRLAKLVGTLALLLGLIRLFPAWYQANSIINHDQGIVALDQTEVKSSPSENSNTVFVLSEGTKVNITRQNDAWMEINIGDANRGWIPKDKIYEI